MNSELYVINDAIELKSRKISKQETKLALLVPNMFNKVSSGYYKKVSKLVKPISEVSPISDIMPNVAVPSAPVAPTPIVNTNIPTEEPKIEPNKVEVPTNSVKEKKYIDKASNMDVIFLRNTKIHATDAAKKLLISPTFVQKLETYRAKAIEKGSQDEVPVVKASTIAAVTTDVAEATLNRKNESSPVPSVTQVLQKITPDIVAKVEKTAESPEGVKKYIELMNKRKEAIALKQQCEKEMTALVNEYNITLEMVNEELAKSGSQEVA